ncbi:M20 family metallopeptidase [Erythrobacter sp. HL-111]|uniref:M20 metallopeptidase family protein n=1 Tax=Erythrobacter sp. HL-111 TaxID=1798193 RepID=UPI0006DA2707|nr:M20 family metallopeptidase [Erythrobacter sp. HL-111]KPP83856.1 MAG: hippurate hydrolase [Erythrobacteraceae bacterium HL-111]SDS79880.1 hippurate hydrolase [Erythrobacter sp. HL-111]
MPAPDLLDAARSLAPGIVSLRRAIHAEPELGLDCPMTMAKVREALADLPLEWRSGPSTTGAVATLTGGKAGAKAGAKADGRRVLLRGDMDALPMEEKTWLAFASTIPGRMHACGHDTHTAMLAGAARLLCERRAEIAGTVDFMFQPGEEGHHGARFMLEDGLIDPLPDAAFALHVMPNARHGVLAGRPGALMAAADQFTITVRGRGGHASMPHDCADPVPGAAAIVGALQAMVTRRFDAASAVVVTVTRLQAGTAHNVIPDEAMLAGTIRTLSPGHREKAHELLAATARAAASAHGVEAECTITPGFPVTLCDPRAVALGAKVARALGGAEGWRDLPAPIMGAEDFSYVLEQVPGAMFFLGVAPEGEDWAQCCAIHSPRMHVDESALPTGTAMLAGCALEFLERGFD